MKIVELLVVRYKKSIKGRYMMLINNVMMDTNPTGRVLWRATMVTPTRCVVTT